LGTNWNLKHVTFGLFEAIDIFGKTLAKTWLSQLNIYNLKKMIIVYVKDKGSNLNTMIDVLTTF
jgi:hypothetical protein